MGKAIVGSKTMIGGALLALGVIWTTASQATPTGALTGTTYYDPDKAYSGFVLFPSRDGKTYLIDMDGNSVNEWNFESFPPWPLTEEEAGGERGQLLVQLEDTNTIKPPANPGNGLTNAKIGQVDWNGNVLWSWGSQQQPAHQHHDIYRLDNGNTLVLDASMRKLKGFSYQMIDNNIKEITPDGKVVWDWAVSDHLTELGFGKAQLELIHQSDDPDFLHLNTAKPLGPNRWFEDGDQRFAPDNILISARNGNVAAIIDRASGKIVWHLGPNLPKTQLGGPVPRPMDQMIGQHDVHMIGQGLPGAGNLLIFDNQGQAGFPLPQKGMFSASRIIEVNPATKEIVWQYNGEMSGRPVWSFYSAFISNAQRLPNGNTLITEGESGRIFQVTPAGEIVWEYVNPHYGHSMKQDPYVTNYVYRALMLDYDWAPEGTPYEEKPVQLDCSRFAGAVGCLPD